MKVTDMGYNTVHVIKSCLLKMLDSVKGTSYADRFENLAEKSHRRATEDMAKEWNQFASDLSEDCRDSELYGIYLFVDHSGCDGTFSGDDCREIATSLRKLLDSDIDLSYVDCAIENLYDVFNEVDSDGLVVIC
ncbi:MAG: hypothetical protein IJT54_05935 [Candidatus Methanomethylophilaceae archaeon]|nr:hypothetical protein [Candidatus Methanomethylophilaceae archaeon]